MSLSNPSTVEKEDDDCTCPANLFYQQYKDQIDKILGKHFETDIVHRVSLSYKKKSRKHVYHKDESFAGKSKSKSIKFSQAAKKVSLAQRISRGMGSDGFEEVVIDEIMKDEFKQLEAGKRRSKLRDDQAILDSMLYKKSSKLEIDNFLQALSRKMDQYMLEEEGGGYVTERGYYIFERFSEESEVAGTVGKISTTLGSVEGEGEMFPYPKAIEEEYMSETMRRALEYLNKHKIADLFKYLGAQLVSNKPCNPIEFLINLLDTCLTYRMGYCDPPLLYMPKHIESLFKSMDPMGTGYIDMNQYHTAMFTLGIKLYNMFPPINSKNMVSKDIFLHKAYIRLKIQLDEMIRSDEPSTISVYTARFPSVGGESIQIKEMK